VPLVVFWQVSRFEFVAWDDGLHIYENPYLQSVTFDNILAFWRRPYAELYIPLTYTLWALTATLARGGLANPSGGAPFDPQVFHLLNLLVHLLNVLVVWRIVRLLLSRTLRQEQPGAAAPSLTHIEWAACGGALLFAVHPIQVEAVSWATGFKDILCGFLSSIAVWQYLVYAGRSAAARASGRAPRGQAQQSLGHYWLATGAFVLALLAKPAAVVVPVVVWLLDTWGWPQTWRQRLPALLAWLGLAVLWGVFTSQVQPPAPNFFITPLWARPLIAGDTVTFYLYKLVVPIWLGPDYGRTPEVMLSQGWVWLTGLVPWGLAVWLWYKRTRLSWLVTTVAVLVAGFLPVLGLVPFAFQAYSTVADRYMYIAMLGPALALAWVLGQPHRRWLVIGSVAVLSLLAIRSAWQTHYWHDTVSLFEHALTVNPRSFVAYNTLGVVLAAQNRLGEATRSYSEALRLWPRYTQAHNNLGNALSRQGKLEEAIQHYTEALRLKPNFAEAHNNLGAALAEQGRIAEAVKHYTTALRLQPAYPRAHYNLGNALSRQGKLEEAMQHYTEALRQQPAFAEAHNNLGAVLVGRERVAEAIRHYSAALRLNPHYVKAHYGLGIALVKQGRIAEARRHFSEVLRLDPNNAAARQFLEQAGGSRDNTMGISRPGVRP
jgi:tetratricopeptide (TPR) repeat protein